MMAAGHLGDLTTTKTQKRVHVVLGSKSTKFAQKYVLDRSITIRLSLKYSSLEMINLKIIEDFGGS